MSLNSEWWDPDNLAKNEERLRKTLTSDNYSKSGDFGSYKAINNGLNLDDSYLYLHNLCDEETLIKTVIDYTKILRKYDRRFPRTIADIGCGAGFTSNVLKNIFSNASVFGYEVSYDAIEYAKEKFPECNFEQKKIDPFLNLSDKKFDLLLCQEFYPFTRTKDLEKHIEWIKFLQNNLNQGGTALITLSADTLSTINNNYKILKKNFPLKKITIVHPRISSKVPIYISRVLGIISIFTWKRLGKYIFLIEN